MQKLGATKALPSIIYTNTMRLFRLVIGPLILTHNSQKPGVTKVMLSVRRANTMKPLRLLIRS